MKRSITSGLLAWASLSLIWSCGNDDSTAQTGRIIISLTDAPFPVELLERAEVSIEQIELRKSGGEGNPFVVVSDAAGSFNLLDLVNGVTTDLVNLDIPVGEYDLIRLHITAAEVELNDGATFSMVIPSGAQSGLKLFIDPSLQVVGGLTFELLLDFDVSRSFVPQGNIETPAGLTGFNFSPVIKVSNKSSAGRLAGTITDTMSNPIEGATISLFASDTLNTSTFSGVEGQYMILGLSAGTYQIEVQREGYVAQLIAGVEISTANVTTLSIELVDE